MEGDERERGFKVQDRRRFSSTGDARDDTVADASPSPEAPPAPSPDSLADPPEAGDAAAPGSEINFATFVISLSAQALALLGEIPDPVDQTTRVDLDGARQIIDILGMLSEKTHGNLDAAETSLLDSALFDLRMKYVDRTQGR